MSCGAPHNEFRHEALFYADSDEFVQRTSAFVREGIEAGEPALVVLSADKIAALRAELDHPGEDVVRFADMAEVGHNPACIIPAWRAFVDEHASERIRGIGEPIWAGRSPDELVECQRHESLLNLAFADTEGFRLLCPYDTGSLPEEVLEEARRSHAYLALDGRELESADFRGLEEVAAPFAEPLPPPGGEPQWRIFQAGSLGAVRAFVITRAQAAGLDADATDDFVLASHEVATNSVVHGGGGGLLRIWEERDAVICEVQDRGVIENPLAGRERPAPGQFGGQGLWLANRLCDLVQIRSFDGGSVVRLHKSLGQQRSRRAA